jgi:HAD superfamily hydrolase (TIGR01509 family)
MIKGVIFDLDGVLADTNSMWVQLYRGIIHKLGISGNLSDDQITKNFGEKFQIVLEELVGKENLEEATKMLEKRINSEDWVNNIKPTPHALEVLEHLREHKFKLGVVSGNRAKILKRSLRILGMAKYFQTTVGADEVKKAKPSPEALLKALSELNLSKSEVIYLGDHQNDVKSAISAGIKVAVVLTGALNHKKARELEPDWIIPDLSRLLKILE